MGLDNLVVRPETVTIVYQPQEFFWVWKRKNLELEKYNGFGGGVEIGETLEESAIRETREESGITIVNPILYGKILFEFELDEQDHLVYFFKAVTYEGIPKETEEMIPEWFEESKIPYNEMWADDRYWMPLLLQEKHFRGNFVFGTKGISRYLLREV